MTTSNGAVSLHAQILALPAHPLASDNWRKYGGYEDHLLQAYADGHRDARYTAAELAQSHVAALTAERDALKEALRELHEAESAMYPPATEGIAAQNAWSGRIAKAHEVAAALAGEGERT